MGRQRRGWGTRQNAGRPPRPCEERANWEAGKDATGLLCGGGQAGRKGEVADRGGSELGAWEVGEGDRNSPQGGGAGGRAEKKREWRREGGGLSKGGTKRGRSKLFCSVLG